MRKIIASKNKVKSPTAGHQLPNYAEFLWYKKHEKALLKSILDVLLSLKMSKWLLIMRLNLKRGKKR
ncbi:MAG: hypothetical protein IPM82_10740 [Saprospiraceae bacterium]|nr:hypothetical protein [Saprospiraceae bacterium]